MAHDDEKFGEKRPPKKDEWGNEFRTFQLHDLKIEKKCTDNCKDHVTMTYSIEMDVVACNQMEAIMLTMQSQSLPTKKDWVTVTRVLSSYN